MPLVPSGLVKTFKPFIMKRFPLLLPFFLLSSCVALTKPQKKAVEEFASSATAFAAAPKSFLQSANQCFYLYGKLEAAATPDINQSIQHLDNINTRYSNWEGFIEKYQTSYQLIEKYAKTLSAFANVDVEKDIDESATSLGSAIDTLITRSSERKINLIPVGFGGLVAKLIKGAGNRYLKKKQRQDLIAFLRQGDTLVGTIHLVFKELVAETLVQGKLAEINRDSRTLYETYLNLLPPSERSAGISYEKWNERYLELRSCARQGLEVLSKVVGTSVTFRKAHAELLATVMKKDAGYLWKDIASFSQTANELYEDIQTYQKSFSR